jgi:hypothetical protein
MIGSLSKVRTLTRWLAVFLFCLLGCQLASDISEEEHESHEHFPPHWPHTIFKASDRLSELIANPAAASPQTALSSQISPQQEFIDLIGWLPILAADSDLDRATFDRIDSASSKLQLRWQEPQPKDLPTLVKDPDAREIITWLADICHQEQSRMQQHLNSP